MHDRRSNGIYALVLGIVVAVGAWVRLRNLSADSIWLDEAVSWLQSKGTLVELISRTAGDNYPPLHNLLLYALMKVSASDAEWVLRLPSALLGIANIAAIYWLGSLVGGRAAGVLAAALLAASSMHIYYSQEARMYSLLALATTLYAASAFLFIKRPSRSHAAFVALSGLALVYSHPFGTLNWIAIAAGINVAILKASDFSRRSLAQWVLANAFIAIGFLPWAVVLLHRAQAIAGNFWPPYPSAGYVFAQLYRLSGGGLAGAAVLVGAAIGLRSNRRAGLVLMIWIVGPMAIALIVSLASTPIFVGRYLIGGIPALVTLAALGMAFLASRLNWSTRIAAAVLLVIASSGKLTNKSEPRQDWRAVAAHLDGRLRDSDCVLVYPNYHAHALGYYLRRPFCAVLPGSIAAIDAHAIAGNRLFAVLVADRRVESAVLRAATGAFGREAGHLRLRSISIIEYRREP